MCFAPIAIRGVPRLVDYVNKKKNPTRGRGNSVSVFGYRLFLFYEAPGRLRQTSPCPVGRSNFEEGVVASSIPVN